MKVQIQKFAEVILDNGLLFRVWDNGVAEVWNNFACRWETAMYEREIIKIGLEALRGQNDNQGA